MGQNALFEKFNVSTGNFRGFLNRWFDVDSTNYPSQWTTQQVRNKAFECPSDPANDKSPTGSCNYLGVMGGGPAGVRFDYTTVSPTTGAMDSGCCGGRIVATNGVLHINSKTKLASIPDGTTNTFLIGESKYFQYQGGPQSGYWGTWASGYFANYNGNDGVNTTPPYPACPGTASKQVCGGISGTRDNGGGGVTMTATINGPNTGNPNSFLVSSNTQGSYHPGGCYFAMADGSVQFVGNDIAISVFRSLGIRDDGLPLGGLP
jgi:prepilin-type processing-associated H-X9-DG protein